MWRLRVLSLVIAHDLLEYRYMDDVTGNLFFWCCSTWRAVLKMFVRLFPIRASESFKKCLAGANYKEEKWRNGDKKSFWLENAWTTRNLHSSCHRVSSLRESRCFAKCFRHYSALTLKNVSKQLYASKVKKKKKKQRRKVAFGTLTISKLAQILEQSSGARQVWVSYFSILIIV